MSDLEILTEAVKKYFAALRAGDMLTILEARANMARLINYIPENEDG